jgi:MraZ protein
LGQARFVGRSEHSLDEKGRLVVPSRFRDRLGQRFYVTIGIPEGYLSLYPEDAWEDEVGKRLDAAPLTDETYERNENFLRYVMQHTEEASLDGQGRFVIPPALRAFAAIERDVVAIGYNRRIELWAKDRLGDVAPTPAEARATKIAIGLK